jgi:hypothetical protein
MKHRKCLVCKKQIKGTKAVGDTKIRDAQKRTIGDAIRHKGQLGYAHLECKKIK